MEYFIRQTFCITREENALRHYADRIPILEDLNKRVTNHMNEWRAYLQQPNLSDHDKERGAFELLEDGWRLQWITAELDEIKRLKPIREANLVRLLKEREENGIITEPAIIRRTYGGDDSSRKRRGQSANTQPEPARPETIGLFD